MHFDFQHGRAIVEHRRFVGADLHHDTTATADLVGLGDVVFDPLLRQMFQVESARRTTSAGRYGLRLAGGLRSLRCRGRLSVFRLIEQRPLTFRFQEPFPPPAIGPATQQFELFPQPVTLGLQGGIRRGRRVQDPGLLVQQTLLFSE